jgi:hypothetical protein
MSTEKTMKTLGCLFLICAALIAIPAAAQAAGSPVLNYKVSTSSTQAGGHPNIDTFIYVGNRSTVYVPAPSCDCNDPADLHFHLPTGVIGDPHATPRCTSQDFGNFECPTDSQIGAADLHINTETPNTECGGQGGGCFAFKIPVYNLIPHPGQAGLLAFFTPLLASPVYEVISPRTESDYGLDVEVIGIEHTFPLAFVDQEIWGVPASEEHFSERLPIGCEPLFNFGPKNCEETVHSTSPEKPFLSNPTTCGVPLTSTVDVRSYDGSFSHGDTTYSETDGCDLLTFNPSMFAQPTTTATDSASGLDVDLQVPQTQSPTVPSPSELRNNALHLPSGLTLNPNAADGKVACTDAEAKFGSREAGHCPENSKIGTLTLTSAALPGPLPGYVYIGVPRPGEKFRIFLVADGFNVHIKLAGVVRPDVETGQLTVHFDELPQAPFSDLNIHLFGSERGSLATATQCDTYTVSSTFTPWDDFLSSQGSAQSFSLNSGPGGSPCPGSVLSFNPTFEAGVVNKTGGAHSPVIVNLTRPDGDQTLDTVNVATPPGLAATLAGVPYCSEAAIAQAASPDRSGVAERESPSCPAASQVGTVIAGIGAGSHPYYAPGNVYLAGPYKGAPLSLVTVVPAVSGPYDLGDVIDRIALHVDPSNAHITASSDPIPHIVEGVPLRTRSVLLQLNRPNFTVNPTNCDPFQINATITGDQGGAASFAPHFQVANCSVLNFDPKMAMKLSGGTKRAQDPALRTEVTLGQGGSNISKVSVVLPKSEQIDNAHIGQPCTRVQYAAKSCPASSQIGFAKAETPLLDKPLEGPVYLRSSTHALPDIVADLEGQIHIDLVGSVDTIKGPRLRTTFEGVPDAAVTKFSLSLLGGSKGLLVNNTNICRSDPRATVRFEGQNGRVDKRKVSTNPPCRKTKRAKRSGHRRALRAREAR